MRLDNRRDLIADLGLRSRDEHTLPDAALLFEALLKWGEAAVDHLVGEFAFAFWNEAQQELLLARDFLGMRPLHFHRGNGFFAFASMPSGLHALEEVPYDLDVDFMIHSLALAPLADGKSYFRQIERVEPGHVVRVTRSNVRQASYWNPTGPRLSSKQPQDHVEGLRALFDEVVKAQLRGSGQVVATQLSAGLDSSAVTATVARQHEAGKVIAFTAVPRPGFDGPTPPGSIANEAALAAETAGLYANVEHILVEGRGESPLKWLDHNFLYQQQPMANLTNASWGQAINRAAKERGAKTLFKGGLGNITVSYAGLEWLPYLMSRGRLKEAIAHARDLARNGVPLSSLGGQMVAPFAPQALWQLARRISGRSAGLASYSAVRQSSLARMSRDTELPTVDPFAARLRALRYGDGGGNAYKGVLAEWGLSIRDPTTDRRIVEYCLAVPTAEFVRDGVPRSLARRTFADRLPAEVANWRKRGCQSADWYEALGDARHDLEREIDAIFRCENARDALDQEWFQETLRSWPTNGWERQKVYRRYRIGLLRGLSAGHFMRKVAGTN
ncbi:MAG: asparagine synthetase B family protein [Sphingomicrobium sp.]